MEPAITNMTAAVFTIKKNKTKINEDRKEICLSTLYTCDCPVRMLTSIMKEYLHSQLRSTYGHHCRFKCLNGVYAVYSVVLVTYKIAIGKHISFGWWLHHLQFCSTCCCHHCLSQYYQKMTKNDQKMTKKWPKKWPKYDQKWPKMTKK